MPSLTEGTYTLFDNIKIFFTDSGAPPSSDDYTTVIVLHGSAFVGAGFEALQSLAPTNNIRMVAMNRRGYRGSTPYTDAEIEGFKKGTKGSLNRVGLVIISFLKTFIEREKIPRAASGGGVVVMGWSTGVTFTLSLFSDLDSLDSETRSLLEEYLKHLILYDPPYTSFGYQPPPVFMSQAYQPWTDTQANLEERFNTFFYWISSSFNHDYKAISTTSLDGYDLRKRTDECVVDSWSPEEVTKYYEPNGLYSELIIRSNPATALQVRENADKALFSRKLLPKLRITYLNAPRSPWLTVWPYLETKRLYEECLASNVDVRPVEFIVMDGVNHCVHQDQPELFMSFIMKSLSAA
ncbi:hypothetical protein VNI00_015814 [Paramarasmius palmivorus]|uniref:AB hydrolase-1 domain-containing protein n=1 Tax=Paramarasmius palmivorus TaxID=297713 RepID=A0AAW0BHW8_9AGAR